MSFFQRSQSKVWFGSQQNSVYDQFSSLPNYCNPKSQLQSITEQSDESFTSPKNESEERKRSFLIWGNRHSPSSQSHKSQDSGFSDTDTSPTNNHENSTTSAGANNQSNHSSPSASSKIATPPTVIRRPEKNHIYEEITASRRISFSEPPSPQHSDDNELDSQIEGINFNNTSPMHANDTSRSSCRSCKIKRSRVITKNSRRRFSNSLDESSDNNNNSQIEHKNYNNETVYFGYGDSSSIMEEKSLLSSSPHTTPLKIKIQPYETSTPKLEKCNGILKSLSELLPQPSVYKNVLLNGNFASVQSWIDELRHSFSSEVMSTLQSKTIETESVILTPTYAFKLIKSLQEKAFMLQQEFEKVEKCECKDNFLPFVQHLADLLLEFLAKQELRKIYYTQNVKQYKKLCENLENMREMSRDLKNVCSKIDVDDLEEFPICDDLLLIKRYFLITVKILFKILMSSLVDNIEHAKNEIMLRSNITHIANLISMVEYEKTTFSSLNDAFVSCSVVRVLLLVCLENKSSWMRALSLRTLSLVCTSEETIQQFEINSGFEIIRDIIMDKREKRLEQEVRESISLLASITAPWQSSLEYTFKELKDYSEDYIEGITAILNNTKSCQTILICVAVLNNLSRLESSSTYSLISNQTLLTLMHVFAQQVNGEYTIFFAEQITAIIANMSHNRKSHYHLTSKIILNFVYDIFLTIHHLDYEDPPHLKAKRKSIKNVLNTLKHLELATSSNEISQNIRTIITNIHRKLFELDIFCETSESMNSFNISRNSKNITKISIFSQETFL